MIYGLRYDSIRVITKKNKWINKIWNSFEKNDAAFYRLQALTVGVLIIFILNSRLEKWLELRTYILVEFMSHKRLKLRRGELQFVKLAKYAFHFNS